MMKTVSIAAVLAIAAANPQLQTTSTQSLWSIENLFDNSYSPFVSGFAFGGISRMIYFESTQTCLTRMFSVSEGLLVLSRLNRQLSTFDLVVDAPLRLYNVLAQSYKAAITCLEENPMFPNFTAPTWSPLEGTFSGGVEPVYDKEFWYKTLNSVIALAFQTNG